MEVWKDIVHLPISPEFPYEVSNFGNVKSLNYNRCGIARVLKLRYSPSGHATVMLAGNGYHSIAQLVLISFGIDKPSDKHIVNHINGNAEDNTLENLEWVHMSVRNKISGKNGFKFPKNHTYGVESRFKKGNEIGKEYRFKPKNAENS